jgi:hypothetical protein
MSAEVVKADFVRHRDDYGGVAICRALQMVPSFYWLPSASQCNAQLRGTRL